MSRVLYRWLLMLHPPQFRRRFADEMLLIYDEYAGSMGAAPLWVDGFISLVRQWVLRTGSWKVAAAVTGAALEITAGSFGWMLYGPARIENHAAVAQFRGTWQGDLHGSERVTPMKVRLGSDGARWTGQVEIVRPDGSVWSATAQGIAVSARAVRFQVLSGSSVLHFDATLRKGERLMGGFETNAVSEQRPERNVLELTREASATLSGLPLGLMRGMVQLIVFAVGPLIVMIMGLALWFKAFTARRMRCLMVGAR